MGNDGVVGTPAGSGCSLTSHHRVQRLSRNSYASLWLTDTTCETVPPQEGGARYATNKPVISHNAGIWRVECWLVGTYWAESSLNYR
jgi:hypothetical protein